jgi:hypothetical protein
MFWKKKPGAVATEKKAAEAKPSAAAPATPEFTTMTEAEILKKIEELSQPGATAFFYLSGSPASGGPLGHGAAVVELNPNYPGKDQKGKDQKKYILNLADVEGMQPVGKGQKFFGSDKPKELARWVKERHYKME